MFAIKDILFIRLYPGNYSDNPIANRSLEMLYQEAAYSLSYLIVANDDKAQEAEFYDLDLVNLTSSAHLQSLFQVKSHWNGQCVTVIPKYPVEAKDLITFTIIVTPKNPGWELPDKIKMIIHESASSWYTLIPGDMLELGANVLEVEVGKSVTFGVVRRKALYSIQIADGLCRNYLNDSQYKCFLRESAVPKILNESQPCQTPQLNTFIKDMVPNASDIFVNECSSHEDYIKMNSKVEDHPNELI